MPMLKLKTPPWAFLVGFSLLLIPATPRALFSPGSPLTDDEYEVFFSSLRPSWKANLVCQIRGSKGCQYPKIINMDEFENHGRIPEGPVCAEFPQRPLFANFCEFAQFRCLNQEFYTKVRALLKPRDLMMWAVGDLDPLEKRILCPKPPLVEETDVLPTAGSESHALASNEASPLSPEHLLQSNIDSILKYSFAVSGQEPVLKNDFQVADNNTETSQIPEWPDYLNAEFITSPPEIFTSVIENVGERESTDQPSLSAVSISIISVEERERTDRPSPPKPSISIIKNVDDKETTDQHLIQHTHHLMGTEELSLENTFKVEEINETEDKKPGLNIQEDVLESSSAGSLLAIDRDEALMILCSVVLHDVCISSAIIKAWKEIEGKTFGFEAMVCDNLGRHHADLCADCAFCSLKTEQCQGASNLQRVPCSDGTFTKYINPGILVQHQAMRPESSPNKEEFFGFESYRGKRRGYWCSRLAAHGCEDYHVALWLHSEYSFFQGGDFPDQICDSAGILHPTYCAFKSSQCMQYTLRNMKVLRTGCLKSGIYRKLSREEGDAEVLLWTQKFLYSSESESD